MDEATEHAITDQVRQVTEIYNLGRLRGRFDAMLEILEHPKINDSTRMAAFLVGWSLTIQNISEKEAGSVHEEGESGTSLTQQVQQIEDYLEKLLKGEIDPTTIDISEMASLLKKQVEKFKEKAVESIDAVSEKLLGMNASQADERQARIKYMLKELGDAVLATTGSRTQVDPEVRGYFENKIAALLKSLAHYGIKAHSYTEAVEQYEWQFGGAEGQSVEAMIEHQFEQFLEQHVSLEAVPDRIIERRPELARFKSEMLREVRKRQSSLRKGL